MPSQSIKELECKICELEKKVSAYQQIEETLFTFQKFIETSSQGLGMATLDGDIIYANPALCKILGEKDPDNIVGKNVINYYPDEWKDTLTTTIKPAALHTGEWTGEIPLLSVQGKITPTIHSIFLMHDKKGQPKYFANIITDIKERKAVEDKLKESEEQYRLLFEHAGAITCFDTNQRLVFANKNSIRELGFDDLESIKGINIETLHYHQPEEKIRMIKERHNNIIKTGKGDISEHVVEFNRGQQWYLNNTQPVKDASGNVIGFVVFSSNITERKHAEEKLLESETKYRLLADNVSDVIWTIDIETLKTTYISPSVERMRGFTPDEIINTTIDYRMPPESIELIKHVFKEESANETSGVADPQRSRTIELKLYHKNGSTIWAELKASFLRDKNGKAHSILGITRDITERKKSEEKWRQFMESATDSFSVFDSNLNLVEINNVSFNIFPVLGSKKDIIGKNISELVPIAKESGRYNRYMDVIKTGKPFIEYNIPADPAYGKLFLNVRSFKVGDGLGIIITDISEYKRVMDALHESSNLYKILVETMNEGLGVIDENGVFTFVNRKLSEIQGCPPEEAVGKHVSCFFDEKNIAVLNEKNEQLKEGLNTTYEIQWINKVGVRKITRIAPAPLFDAEGNYKGAFAVISDITETKHLQDKLIQSERMAVTGQLAASVAHEINSPLQGIASLLDVIKNTHKDDIELIDNITLVSNAFKTIRDTVRNLLDLNRPGNEKKLPVNVNNIIESTLALVRSHLKKTKIKINLSLSGDLPDIVASPQQMGQVFVNLINNSIDAIMSNPLLKDTSGKDPESRGTITIVTYMSDKHIHIKISDTGPGIPENNIPNVFDPFFTEKKKIGMGMGLSICYNIIEDHSGVISADNALEGGAVFTIILPAK